MDYRPVYSTETFNRAEALQSRILQNMFPCRGNLEAILACDSLLPWQHEPISEKGKTALIAKIERARSHVGRLDLNIDHVANEYLDWLEKRFEEWLAIRQEMSDRHEIEREGLNWEFSGDWPKFNDSPRTAETMQ